MNLNMNLDISTITVFLQGVLSFFSPCILPIIPLYMGYLSSGSRPLQETNGETQNYKNNVMDKKVYNQKKILLHTICFVFGISFAFFILGLGFSTLGQFLSANQSIITTLGGLVILVFGCIQLGVFKNIQLYRNFKIPFVHKKDKMDPFTAFVMGFTFSFAWTPCVGPALSTVLIMVTNSTQKSSGMILMGVYTFGFILPFLFLGFFTSKVLEFMQAKKNIVRYTTKIGAIIMILIGIFMITGYMTTVSSYLTPKTDYNVQDNLPHDSSNTEYREEDQVEENIEINDQEGEEDRTTDTNTSKAQDFQLLDQYGIMHKLSDYKDKVIFLNFWATWCPPCVQEMPDIQKIYEEYGYNKKEVIILGVAMPSDNNSYTREGSLAQVKEFLKTNNYTYPTVMDMDGSLAALYGINSFPTTFLIDKNTNIFGYIPGMIDINTMKDAIEQTKDSN